MTTENGLTAVNGTSQDRLHPIKPVIAPTPLAGLDPLAGQLGHLTSDQEKAFASFKSLVSAEGLYQSTPTPSHEDGTLLRFLRARKFDPQEALKQFSEMEKWRKETGTLGIQAFYDAYDINEFEEAKKVFTMWTGRRVRTGQPFYVLKVKDLDNKAMNRYFQSSTRAKNSPTDTKTPPPLVALYEHMMQLVFPLLTKLKDRPHPETPISSSCNLVDISGVSLMQFFGLRGHLGDASAFATARYPETLGTILIVGAPSYMELVFSFISQRFDPNTRSKIALLPADKNLAFRKLSEFIEPINIPKVYGGELDWDFGDFPAVEPEITKALGMDLKDWPRGPAKVVGDELIAVGKTEDGIQRNTVLGRFQM